MTTKDWIVLVTPIIFNGIIIFTFQKLLSQKIEQTNKRQGIRDDVVKRFWNKLQDLNDTFIRVHIKTMKEPETLSENLETIKENILELIMYYDTNKYDLDKFSNLFEEMETKWNCFVELLREYSNVPLTSKMQEKLGSKLQDVKEANQKLIAKVRENY